MGGGRGVLRGGRRQARGARRDGTALEFAIGTGRIALPLAERGVRVVGIDSLGLREALNRALCADGHAGRRGSQSHGVRSLACHDTLFQMEKTAGARVYIVTIDVPTSQFRSYLDAIDGARLVRELPPRRVVVALRSPADRPQLTALPAVEGVVPDSLERPDRSN